MSVAILQIVFFFMVVTCTPNVMKLQSTSWSALGYPILDRPIEYPYIIELFDGRKTVLYEDGPEGINEGDVYKLQLNTAQYKVNGTWYQVGALFPDGKYLRIASDYVDNSELQHLNATDYTDFDIVENEILQLEKELGDQTATDDMAIQYYLGMLHGKGKQLDGAKQEVLFQDQDKNSVTTDVISKRHGVVCANNNRCARVSRCSITADSGSGVWYCTCPNGYCITAGGYICNGTC